MKDYLGNEVNADDTVLISIRSGRTSTLGRGYVKEVKMKKQFATGPLVPMVLVEWSNIHKYWMPARHVVALPDDMLPEKRREKLNNVKEGIEVS